MQYLVRNVKIILIYLIFAGCSSKVSQPTYEFNNRTLKDSNSTDFIDHSTVDINYTDPLLFFSFIILLVLTLVIILFLIKKFKT